MTSSEAQTLKLMSMNPLYMEEPNALRPTLLNVLNCRFRKIKCSKAIPPNYEETNEKKRRRIVIFESINLLFPMLCHKL